MVIEITPNFQNANFNFPRGANLQNSDLKVDGYITEGFDYLNSAWGPGIMGWLPTYRNNIHIEGVNLSGKHMRESSFIGANFKGANLSGGGSKSNFQNADFNQWI